RFARERQPWTFHTASVPTIAVLNSATTHYARARPSAGKELGETHVRKLYTDDGKIVRLTAEPNDSRIYWYGGEFAEPQFLGVYEALVECQLHFDIVNEDVLTRRIKEYELVILPEQFSLQRATIDAIDKYVAQGGRLLATGATIESGLASVLGVHAKKQFGEESSEFPRKEHEFAHSVVYDIEPDTARTVGPDTVEQSQCE